MIKTTKTEMLKEIGRLRNLEYDLRKQIFYKNKKLKDIISVLFREENETL